MKKLFLLICAIPILLYSCEKDDQTGVSEDYQQSTGVSANDLLSASNYTSMVVEIQYMAGFAPSQGAVDNLESFITELVNKPDGITFNWNGIPAAGQSSYSVGDIKDIEDMNRSSLTSGAKIAVYFLFLDGEFTGNSGNSKTLGVAYRNTSMAIFQKTVQEFSDEITEPDRSKLETVIMNHEFGHILGLVNVGTPMQVEHQDEARGAHCDNDDCLMYFTAETGSVVSNLVGTAPIPTLDANCRNDLSANGGK